MKKTFIGAALICLSAVQLAKGVYIDFSGTPGAQPVSMTLAQDVNFTITQAANPSFVIFAIDNLFATPDAGLTMITYDWSAQLELSINGGEHFKVESWVDNLGYDYNDVTAGDGYFFSTGDMGPFTLSVGDVVTLHAGTMTSLKPPPADFNLGTSGNYDIFIVDDENRRINDVIPEPATALSLVLGGGVLGLIRRFYGRT